MVQAMWVLGLFKKKRRMGRNRGTDSKAYGPIVSFLMTKFSYRKIALCGSCLVAIGLIGMPLLPYIPTMCFFFGVLTGFGNCCAYIPSHVLSGLYYDKYRSIATGISTSGSGLGSAVMPVLVGFLIDVYSWKGSLIFVAGLNLHIFIFAALLRYPPDPLADGAKDIPDSVSVPEVPVAAMDICQDDTKYLVTPKKRRERNKITESSSFLDEASKICFNSKGRPKSYTSCDSYQLDANYDNFGLDLSEIDFIDKASIKTDRSSTDTFTDRLKPSIPIVIVSNDDSDSFTEQTAPFSSQTQDFGTFGSNSEGHFNKDGVKLRPKKANTRSRRPEGGVVFRDEYFMGDIEDSLITTVIPESPQSSTTSRLERPSEDNINIDGVKLRPKKRNSQIRRADGAGGRQRVSFLDVLYPQSPSSHSLFALGSRGSTVIYIDSYQHLLEAQRLLAVADRSSISSLPLLSRHIYIFTNYGFNIYFLSNVMWNAGYAIIQSFAPEFLQEKGLTLMQAAWLSGTFGLSSFICGVLGGICGNIEGINRQGLYRAASIVMGVVTIIFPIYQNFILYASMLAISGFAFGVILGLLIVVLTDLVGVESLGNGLGYLMLSNGLGTLHGSSCC